MDDNIGTSPSGTITNILLERASAQPDDIAFIFITDDKKEKKITYKELYERSVSLASKLEGHVGERALIFLPSGLEYIIAFMGCLYAGVIAVPAYPPRNNKHMERLQAIIDDSAAKFVITNNKTLEQFDFDQSVINIDKLEKTPPKKFISVKAKSNDLAFLQYTSGSTGSPKGVMVLHSNIVANCLAMEKRFGKDNLTVGCSWVPPFHDMGLLGGILLPIYGGFKGVILAPAAFVRNPIIWLELVSKYKASFSTAPNFAYDLCVQKARNLDSDEKLDINLSSWKIALNGSEPVREHTLNEFIHIFKDYGFDKRTCYPAYGMAEATVFISGPMPGSLVKTLVGDIGHTLISSELVACGCVAEDHQLLIVNPKGKQSLKDGEVGEIWVSGPSITDGYWNKPKATEETFKAYLSNGEGPYLRTGDLGLLQDGQIYIVGRLKDIIIIRGENYAPQDIEHVVEQSHPGIRKQSSVAAISYEEEDEEKLAIIAEVERSYIKSDLDEIIKSIIQNIASDFEINVSAIVLLKPAGINRTSSGKIQRKACKKDFIEGKFSSLKEWRAGVSEALQEEYVAASDDIEDKMTQVWQEVLKLEKIGIHDQFFGLGGNSLLAGELQLKLKRVFNVNVGLTDIFQYPTIAYFSDFIRVKYGLKQKYNKKRKRPARGKAKSQDIAIIGISCRVADADNKEEFWSNLTNNVESIRDITDKELLSSGLKPKDISGPNYVKRGSFINNLEYFDAGFFAYSPLDAKSMDPQQRHFFECSWEALEDAGIVLSNDQDRIGVFAGRGYNSYLHGNVRNSELEDTLGSFHVHVNNAYLSTKVSYHFNLDGPSFDIDTACSTSLVSVKLAIDSIISGQCDIALAGGVTLSQISGYLYQEGMINSPDGRCRTFDADASGTIFGSAVGVVVLKRLDDAIADNDQVYAVIKGSAINNDGSLKVSFTAPSVEGQYNVITDAIEKAGVDPETISYLEAHGTATLFGDPIEISALTQAYRNFTDKKQYCAIGSVKTNIGHTDTAAGVVGLIKTALALKNKKIPASLHFDKPNPEIDFENSPFFVNAELKDWEVPEGTPRRAGVSSFGIGGTNAHAILEEAPEREVSSESRKQQLLLLSAKTDTSVSAYADKLADFLKENKADIKLADIAYTLQVGRDSLKHRRCYVAESFDQAIDVLGKKAAKAQIGEISQEGVMPDITFMFSGQGAQYVNMARGLYEQEPLFKEIVDQCCDILKNTAELDLLEVLYPKDKADIKAATDKITQTNYAQPALFVIEYALAKLLMHWGIEPKTMIGHSIGEYIAATIAGVFELKDALLLVATRGKLMHAMKAGSMLSVNLEESKLKDLLPKNLNLAAVNSPSLSVVSGESKAIKDFQDKLEKKDISCTLLHTSHAFHSPMMQAAADEFLKVVKKVKKGAPKIGFISNLTGKAINKNQAMSDQYWVDHLLNAVLFDKGVSLLLTDKLSCLVEIGPGRTLSTFALQNKAKSKSHHILTSIRHPKDEKDDLAMLLNLVGRLWLAGVEIDYDAFYEQEKRNKISIPTYCFDHKKYWIEPQIKESDKLLESEVVIKPNMEDWFYEPSWKKANLPKQLTSIITKDDNCLIFEDGFGVAESLAASLKDKFSNMIRVKVGDKFCNKNDNLFIINPNNKSDYIELLQALADRKIAVQHVVHAWSLSEYIKDITTDILANSNQLSFYSLLYLSQGLIEVMPQANVNINVLTNNLWAIGDEVINPQMSTITGPIKVITQEHPELRCRHIDIMLDSDEGNNKLSKWVKNTFITEFGCEVGKGVDREICYRYGQRWVRGFELIKLDKGLAEGEIEDGTVYLITGGLGGMGLSFAKYFAQKAKVKLALVSRKKLPEKSQWSDLIENNTDHAQFNIVEKLLEIESLGAEVMVCSADIANESQAQAMIDDVINKFSKIDVAIHAAGIPGGGIIDFKTSDMVEKVFAPKLQGTVFLANLMQKVKPGRIVFCSSVSAIYGALSQIDYAGANAFLDSYAKYFEKLTGIKTVSINWLFWNEIGMAEETDVPDVISKEREQERLYGVDPQEGCQIYEIIVNSGLEQVTPSKVDVEAALLGIEQVALDRKRTEVIDIDDTGDVKSVVSNIWKAILGVEDIDDDDDFFELGGHSLLAAQLMAKLQMLFGLDLTTKFVFEFRTLKDMTYKLELLLEIKDIRSTGEAKKDEGDITSF